MADNQDFIGAVAARGRDDALCKSIETPFDILAAAQHEIPRKNPVRQRLIDPPAPSRPDPQHGKNNQRDGDSDRNSGERTRLCKRGERNTRPDADRCEHQQLEKRHQEKQAVAPARHEIARRRAAQQKIGESDKPLKQTRDRRTRQIAGDDIMPVERFKDRGGRPARPSGGQGPARAAFCGFDVRNVSGKAPRFFKFGRFAPEPLVL